MHNSRKWANELAACMHTFSEHVKPIFIIIIFGLELSTQKVQSVILYKDGRKQSNLYYRSFATIGFKNSFKPYFDLIWVNIFFMIYDPARNKQTNNFPIGSIIV